MNPFLSVVMPTYNGEEYIASALESVREQLDDGIELVVVDDGSSDRTLDIVRDFASTLPIRLITPGRIGNWVAVSNIGLREARGEWACLLHQDDFWLPGRIARLRAEMEGAKEMLIFHEVTFVGPDGQTLGRSSCPFREGIVSPERLIERLLVQNFITPPAPVFRRRVAIDSGPMDESLWFSADWDFWLRLATFGPVRFVDERLAAIRLHAESQTVARKIGSNEWEQQLTAVLTRHLQDWSMPARRRKSVQRAATFSIAVNSALAAVHRGDPVRLSPLLFMLLRLGPSGWYRYLRDSRIVERVSSRLKVKQLSTRIS